MVQVDNNRLTISEADGAPNDVILRATLPVLCKDSNRPCRACTTVATDGRMVTDEQVSINNNREIGQMMSEMLLLCLRQ